MDSDAIRYIPMAQSKNTGIHTLFYWYIHCSPSSGYLVLPRLKFAHVPMECQTKCFINHPFVKIKLEIYLDVILAFHNQKIKLTLFPNALI